MAATASTSVSLSFLRAAERCLAEQEVDANEPSRLLVPAVVCAAFSIEVGIKSLLCLQGNPQKGHRLLALYQALPPELQQKVACNSAYKSSEFKEGLVSISAAFVDWRYIYEKDKDGEISMEFLLRMANAVQKTIKSAVGGA